MEEQHGNKMQQERQKWIIQRVIFTFVPNAPAARIQQPIGHTSVKPMKFGWYTNLGYGWSMVWRRICRLSGTFPSEFLLLVEGKLKLAMLRIQEAELVRHPLPWAQKWPAPPQSMIQAIHAMYSGGRVKWSSASHLWPNCDSQTHPGQTLVVTNHRASLAVPTSKWNEAGGPSEINHQMRKQKRATATSCNMYHHLPPSQTYKTFYNNLPNQTRYCRAAPDMPALRQSVIQSHSPEKLKILWARDARWFPGWILSAIKKLYYIISYYTILYYTILYYTILHYTILYYTLLNYTILLYCTIHTVLYYTIQHYTILYYTILYYTILNYTILLYCTIHTVLYYTIQHYTILYYTILYYTILLYCTIHTVLYYTIQHYTILYYTILYYTILYYTILHYTILYFTKLYYTIILYYTYCTILYYTTLYYTILYYTILYCTVLYYTTLYYTILY